MNPPLLIPILSLASWLPIQLLIRRNYVRILPWVLTVPWSFGPDTVNLFSCLGALPSTAWILLLTLPLGTISLSPLCLLDSWKTRVHATINKV